MISTLEHIVDTTINSISTMHYLRFLFGDATFILLDDLLNIVNVYGKNNIYNKMIDMVQHNFLDIYHGYSAVTISKASKSVSIVMYEEHDDIYLKKLCTCCSPIKNNTGLILGYITIITTKESDTTKDHMLVLMEVISKLISENYKKKLFFINLKKQYIKNNLFDKVTEKERLIVEKVSQGFTDDIISQTLFMSKSTLRSHLNNICNKLELKGRTTLTYYYFGYILNKLAKELE